MLCNASQHFGADFITIVEGENKIRPAIAGKCFVRTGLSFDFPAKTRQNSKQTLGFN